MGLAAHSDEAGRRLRAKRAVGYRLKPAKDSNDPPTGKRALASTSSSGQLGGLVVKLLGTSNNTRFKRFLP
jgi:hypothetical protein